MENLTTPAALAAFYRDLVDKVGEDGVRALAALAKSAERDSILRRHRATTRSEAAHNTNTIAKRRAKNRAAAKSRRTNRKAR